MRKAISVIDKGCDQQAQGDERSQSCSHNESSASVEIFISKSRSYNHGPINRELEFGRSSSGIHSRENIFPTGFRSGKCLKSLGGIAVFGGVVELNFATGASLRGVDDAGIERAGIDVQADRALVELARVEHAMHRLVRVDGAGLSGA